VSHTRIGYALSLICMFLIWLATLSQYLTEPHYHTSFACLTSDWLYSQYLTEPHYHARARQCLCKKLYCICTHWLFVQTYAWWPAVVSATLQRHMWLPTGPQAYVVGDGLEHLILPLRSPDIFLPPPSKGWCNRCVLSPPLIWPVVGLELRASCVSDRHPNHWATPAVYCPPPFFPSLLNIYIFSTVSIWCTMVLSGLHLVLKLHKI
jgi:hypothetical protein